MGEYAPDFAQHEVTGVALSSMKDKDIKEEHFFSVVKQKKSPLF